MLIIELAASSVPRVITGGLRGDLYYWVLLNHYLL